MHGDAAVGGFLPRAAAGSGMVEVGLDRSQGLLKAGNISRLGKTEGDLESFRESGHAGDFFDYHADQAAVEGKKRYFAAMKYDEAMEEAGRGDRISGYRAVADYDAHKTAGVIREGEKHGVEAKALGETKGRLDALQTVAAFRGIEAVGEGAYLDARRDAVIDDVAKWGALRSFAESRGVDFERFAADRHRTADISVNAAEAKRYGLPGAGSYRMAWGGHGELLFTNRSSGSQYQVGTFGKSGRDIAGYNISRSEEGNLRKIYSNFTDRVGGSHSVRYDDFRESVSGFRGRGYNVSIVEDASMAGGHRVMVFDPSHKKPVLVSGNINHLVSSYRQTADGATKEAIVPLTGDVLASESTIGSVRTQNQDRLNVNMGVKADGTVTEGVRKVAGETVAVGAAASMDGLASIGSTVRSVKQLGELGNNFKLNRTKGEPTLEGGETAKGEISPGPASDPVQ
jgi:hypothetical protein